MGFSVPISAENPNGWGPPGDSVPEDFADVPYSPFSKSDKLGRAADWTQTGFGKFGGSACPAGVHCKGFRVRRPWPDASFTAFPLQQRATRAAAA